MSIEFLDLFEVKVFSTFSDVPLGAIVQYLEGENLICAIKTKLPQQDVFAALLIGGDTNGKILYSEEMPFGPYIDVGDVAKIVVLNPGFVPQPKMIGSLIEGCVYKITSIEGVYFMWGTMPILPNKFWVCIESSVQGRKRGDSTSSLTDFLPISTRVDVRRKN